MARGDFLAPILAPTLRILDPSAKRLGQMYLQACYVVLGQMTIIFRAYHPAAMVNIALCSAKTN